MTGVFNEAKTIKLKKITSFCLGGTSKIIVCKNQKDLPIIIKNLIKTKTDYFIIGDGSNIIASDRGFRGIILKIAFNKIKVSKKEITCEAGVPLIKLINTANRSGLDGLETLAGIPGTVGGAIFGNAGAYGKEISENLNKVKIFDGSKITWLPKNKCGFAYRESIFKLKADMSRPTPKKYPWVILEAFFKLQKGDKKALVKKSKKIIASRNKKYKPGLKCAGSIFKNIPIKSPIGKKLIKKIPPGKIIGGKIPAGFILETIGAKGTRNGGISVAKHHANLLINNGRGRAKEARDIIKVLKKKVRAKYGITLKEEIRYL